MAARKTKDETVEVKARKPRDTTPVTLLSEITEVDSSSIPVGARQRSDNPFTEPVRATYEAGFGVGEDDRYASAQVDNVARAVRQLHTAAQINGIGVRVLVQDIDGGFERDSQKAGIVWFRGKEKNERKTATDAGE